MAIVNMVRQTNKKIELLAPGGDTDCVKAAIIAGADAVYCGTASFNARQRAANLSIKELGQLVRIAQQKNCRLYLTLNTLLFDHEIPQIIKLLEQIYRAGIRVVIVQDFGLLHIIKTWLPQFEAHASTQLTTHNEGQISFLSRFSVTQINLSRELSVSEIKPLCSIAHHKGIKTEVFVHGAFCISFSGQCYMSSDLCGKSGNRGECVQPCRRQYTPQHSKKSGPEAIFNLRDNCLFSKADALLEAGVDSLKIEGRIKKFLYVYNVTSAWREQIDALEASKDISRDDKRLRAVFNRKFTSGYLDGSIESDMFIDTSRDQSLKYVAKVSGYWADKKILSLESGTAISPNTEILIYTPDFTFVCKGVLTEKISATEYQFTIEHKLKGKISKGCQIFAHEFSDEEDRIKSIVDSLEPAKVPLRVTVSGTPGEKLKAKFSSPRESLSLFSQLPLSEASQRPLDRETLVSQFSRLGTSKFLLDRIDTAGLSQNCFIPLKELNRIRCEAVDKLTGNAIDASEFEIPDINQPNSSQKRIKKALFVEDIADAPSPHNNNHATAFVIPNRIADISKLADSLNRNSAITPFFSSILIGQDFTDAVTLLQKLDGRRIMTDNSGIADAASQMGVQWVAGPAFNIVNSYAVAALTQIEGFCGLFLSSEFSKKERGELRIPAHIDLWQAVNFRKTLMTTRQCLIRNISGCKKSRCDDNCLLRCDRSEVVSNSQGKKFLVAKRKGFYTVVERKYH